MTRRHTGSCATAQAPGCRCICLNTRHGLEGRLVWAAAIVAPTDVNEAMRLQYRDRKEEAKKRLIQRITIVKKRRASRKFTRANTVAAVEYSRTKMLVEWLVEHPTEREQLESIVASLVEASKNLVQGWEADAALRARLLDHLWCDLVASIVRALELAQNLEAQTKAEFSELIALSAVRILKSVRMSADGFPVALGADGIAKTRAELDSEAELDLESDVLRMSTEKIVLSVMNAATADLDAYIEVALVQLRLAALMLCADPTEHKLVWDHCWLPLWDGVVADAALEAFSQFVPELTKPLTV